MTCNAGTKFEMDECEHLQGKDNIKEESTKVWVELQFEAWKCPSVQTKVLFSHKCQVCQTSSQFSTRTCCRKMMTQGQIKTQSIRKPFLCTFKVLIVFEC